MQGHGMHPGRNWIFFSRSKYPVFAVSLYNLVPACGNCNRIKSGGSKAFASPFDEKLI